MSHTTLTVEQILERVEEDQWFHVQSTETDEHPQYDFEAFCSKIVNRFPAQANGHFDGHINLNVPTRDEELKEIQEEAGVKGELMASIPLNDTDDSPPRLILKTPNEDYGQAGFTIKPNEWVGPVITFEPTDVPEEYADDWVSSDQA